MQRWMSTLLGAAVVALALSTAGCAGTVHGTATVSSSGPTLVWLDSGLWVVQDAAYPVFYSGGFYWRYNNGYWYRSRSRGHAWVYVEQTRVPRVVRRIRRPHRYIHYRPRGHVRTRRGPRLRRTFRPSRHIRVKDRGHTRPPVRVKDRGHTRPPVRVKDRGHTRPPVRVKDRGHKRPPVRVKERGHGHVKVKVKGRGKTRTKVKVKTRGKKKTKVRVKSRGKKKTKVRVKERGKKRHR